MDPTTNAVPPGKLASLPRRATLGASTISAAPARMRFAAFKFSRLQALRQLLAFSVASLQFILATGLDWLQRRDSTVRRARRLRRLFETRGGVLIKLGIHLSTRVDFMPWTYSVELSRMRDDTPPFPVAEAIAAVERAAGQPLPAVFHRFDPTPIAATSVACTYQAVLHNQEKVIVKVRRPAIGAQFMAGLQAFDWLLQVAEALTIFRPGFTRGMRAEFRQQVLDELDFVHEARRQDSFRRSSAASGLSFFTAPRVYLGMSDDEVVVEEFANGMWLSELLTAVETGDQDALALARQRDIDPATVARRLMWVNFWSWEDNLFFHADPHPKNIILGEGGRLYFINFSSTGALSRSKRQAMQQNMLYICRRDPLNMARAELVLMEPLPPVDLLELTQELESYNWQLLYALEAAPEGLAWHERTSSHQWRGMIALARKYGIVLDSEVLQLVRSTLMLESAAVRLDNQIDFARQHSAFESYRAEQARRRMTDRLLDQLDGEPDEKIIMQLDRMAEAVEGLFFRTRHMLALPSVNFNAMASKWSYAVFVLLRFGLQALAITGAALLAAAGLQALGGQTPQPAALLGALVVHPAYQVALAALAFINGRSVLFRMDDKDVRRA